MGAQPALLHLLYTPYQTHGKWFLLSVLGYKASLQLVFSWLFMMIYLQFSLIPDWSWEELSVVSIYSSAILDLNF